MAAAVMRGSPDAPSSPLHGLGGKACAKRRGKIRDGAGRTAGAAILGIEPVTSADGRMDDCADAEPMAITAAAMPAMIAFEKFAA